MQTKHTCRSIAATLLLLSVTPSWAQAPTPPTLEWTALNRFRLFADETDFNRLAEAHKGKSVLAAERDLATATDGQGWVRDLGRLCFDANSGAVPDVCMRDGRPEKYINPVSHRVALAVTMPAGSEAATCAWTIGQTPPVETFEQPCSQPAIRPFRNKRATPVAVAVRMPSGDITRLSTSVEVRDLLIVGMGDSLASGEGNPHRPIALSENGFCFHRALDGTKIFFAPARDRTGVERACPAAGTGPDELNQWEKIRAQWMYAPCHRSLYGYQARTALALAIVNTHAAVTYIPLGCTGATIAKGLLDSQPSRERLLANGAKAPRVVEGQVHRLETYLQTTRNRPPIRTPDLILLTIGANDMGFSELVANVMIPGEPERHILDLAKMISTPAKARPIVKGQLKSDFARLRPAMARLTGGNLDRILFVPYGNPAQTGNAACPSSRHGFDVHPAFGIDGPKTAEAVDFVENEFIPALKRYATCGGDDGCTDSARQTMLYADGHRSAFASHGFCATASDDPSFDNDCFLANGTSFQGAPAGLEQPLKCGFRTHDFRAYASRKRWVRTANDSYFAAMTFPTSLPIQSSDIHDAIWGLTSAVYGGAIHPTAEGHAAMADAALPEAMKALGLDARQQQARSSDMR